MTTNSTATNDAPPLADEQLAAILAYFQNHGFVLAVEADATRNPPQTVTEALCRVMAELPGIGKDQRSEQGYNYRGIESITQHAQHLFARYGVVFGAGRVVARETLQLTINSRPWTEEQLQVVYRIFGPSHGRWHVRRIPVYNEQGSVAGAVEIDEQIEDWIDVGPFYGFGRDNSDKGANKAMTQAYKYALIQTLCVGDAKDDADREEAHAADEGSTPGPPRTPTVEEWSVESGGWATNDERLDAVENVRAQLKRLRDEKILTEEETRAAWDEYKRPPRLKGDIGAADRAWHDEWWQKHIIGPVEPAPDAAEPEPPNDESPSEPVGADEPAPDGASQPSAPEAPTPADTPASGPNPPTPKQLAYRDVLDETYLPTPESPGDTDRLIATLKSYTVEQLMIACERRGIPVPGGRTARTVMQQKIGLAIMERNKPSAGGQQSLAAGV